MNVSRGSVEAAFRVRALQTHPGKHHSNMKAQKTAEFRKVSEAKDHLISWPSVMRDDLEQLPRSGRRLRQQHSRWHGRQRAQRVTMARASNGYGCNLTCFVPFIIACVALHVLTSMQQMMPRDSFLWKVQRGVSFAGAAARDPQLWPTGLQPLLPPLLPRSSQCSSGTA